MKCSPMLTASSLRPVCPVGKLQQVQQVSCVLQGIHHQSLKGFHDYRRQGDGHAVTQPCDGGFLGDREVELGAFEAKTS